MSTLNQIEVKDKLYDIEDKQARNDLLNKVDKAEGKGLSTNDFTNENKEKLDGLSNYDDTELRNEIGNKANKNEIPSIDGLATEEYVDNAIANIDIPEGGSSSIPMQPLTFTGAVNATYDGSEAVSVDIPTGGTGDVSSGGGYEELINFTTTEPVNEIRIPFDDTIAEKLSKALRVYILLDIPKDTSETETTTTGKVSIYLYTNWKQPVILDIPIISPPSVSWAYSGRMSIICENPPCESAKMPKFKNAVYQIDNYGSVTTVQSADVTNVWVNSTKPNRYFIISGTQNMATGTRFIVGVV